MKTHRDTQTLKMDGLLPEVAQQAPEPLPLFGGPLESEEQAQAKGKRDPRWWDCPARTE